MKIYKTVTSTVMYHNVFNMYIVNIFNLLIPLIFYLNIFLFNIAIIHLLWNFITYTLHLKRFETTATEVTKKFKNCCKRFVQNNHVITFHITSSCVVPHFFPLLVRRLFQKYL